MARLKKPRRDYWAIEATGDDGIATLHVVKGGNRAYVGIWGNSPNSTFSGPKTLRAIAKAILKEVGEK
jgi:hypothetical protein